MCVFCEIKDPVKIGRYLGYPKCCIDWYIEYSKKYGSDMSGFTPAQQIVNEGAGFVPCPECSLKILTNKMEVKDLIKNRVCSVPYPFAMEKADKLKKEVRKYVNS